ncbi:hypothetical protein RD792_015002 [Penstemon davidsonii]|uniref:F-box domain-containing protein n=1 Tax=Penstemon davidsonii TaxID=160366 RepID=A0ABR0CSF7_9LAMI|nr:hypothetical protein RD792_015002 [Penstemon davidsonii]
MSDTLSADLLMEILSRVPAESLLGFRSVCKDWCRMIDDPYINIHLERQLLKTHDSSNGAGHLLLVNHNRQLCSLSLLNLLQFDCPLKFETTRMMNPNPLGGPGTSICLCNGLILVCCSIVHKIWSIWNPLTKEIHRLPPDSWSEIWTLDVFKGFGYDSGADDYKVLKHIQYVDPVDRISKYVITCVYSMKSDSWKRIEDFPFWIMRFGLDRSSGVFYNGALHWIGKRFHEDIQTENLIVVAFDLKTEDSRTYPIPSLQLDGLKCPILQLDELYGCLSLSLYSDFKRFEIWLMNDYGVKNSWTKLLTIEENSFIRGNARTPRTINYLNSKGLILLQISKTLCLYDPGNDAMEEFGIPGNLKLFSSQVFRPSLVRIKKGVKW